MLLGGAAAWPLAVRAQQTKVYRIGALLVGNADADTLRAAAARRIAQIRLRSKAEIVRLRLPICGEKKLDLLPKLAAELVALKVDVIVAVYTPCALAAQTGDA